MESIRRILRSPVMTVVLFVLAAGLLLTSAIGGTRAALEAQSETYSARMQMYDIGVTLLENGTPVAWRNYIPNSDNQWDTVGTADGVGTLFGSMLGENDDFQMGRAYREELAVRNSGTIDEYVRVTIYKYWVMDNVANAEKLQNLSPSLIDLHLLTGDNGWMLDETRTTSTKERTVLYYTNVLPSGGTTPNLCDTVTVNGDVIRSVTQTESTETRDGRTYRVITTTYDYDGAQFVVEAEVDAVQTHNAHDAILSAWGRDVTLVGEDGAAVITAIN